MPNRRAPQRLSPVARGLRPVHLTPHTTLIGLPAQHHRSIEQRRQVVCQHLGRHIYQQGMLAQATDTLQAQALLQALERLLDSNPARREHATWRVPWPMPGR